MADGPSWAALTLVDWIGLIVVLLFWVLVPIAIYLLVSRGPSPRAADDAETWDWISHARLFPPEDAEQSASESAGAGFGEAAPAHGT